jgi:hypothetical protein
VVAERRDTILDARGMHHAVTLKPAGSNQATCKLMRLDTVADKRAEGQVNAQPYTQCIAKTNNERIYPCKQP